jgi:hypothetical protein
MFFCFSMTAQVNKQVYPGKKTIKTSETLNWSQEVKNDRLLYLTVGFVVETVNTSNFQAGLYIDGSFDNRIWDNISTTGNAAYTFTQTTGVNSTMESYNVDNWNYPFVRARAVATSDAQTIYVTPWIKTATK